MALLFMDGFNHYASADILLKWTSNQAGASIAAGAGRRADNCLRFNSGGGYYIAKSIPQTASLVIGFALNAPATTSSHQILGFMDGTNNQCSLYLDLNRTLSVRDAFGAVVAGGQSTQTLSVGTYNQIEMKVTIADSIAAASCEVRVNGSSWLTVTAGADLKYTANAYANSIALGGMYGGANWDYCDFYICDQSGAVNNNFLGDVAVYTVLPDAAGSNTTWTPLSGANYTNVNEAASNGDTSYNYSSTLNNRDTFSLANLTSLGGTVFGVAESIIVRKTGSKMTGVKATLKSGVTYGQGTEAILGTGYQLFQSIFQTDPNTAGSWTETTVNALEAGIELTT